MANLINNDNNENLKRNRKRNYKFFNELETMENSLSTIKITLHKIN